MTYVRRPFSSWRAGFWILFGLYQLFFGWLPGDGVSATSLACGVLFLGGALWLHFREQMVDSRRRLTPKFIPTHIAVFLTLSAFLIGVGILLLVQNVKPELLATTGLLLLLFGYIGCCVATQIRILPYLGFGGLFWFLAWYFSQSPHAPLADAPTTMMIACLGAALTFGAMAWMSWITEEHWGYVKPVGFDPVFQISRATGRILGKILGPSQRHRIPTTPAVTVSISYGAPMANPGAIRTALRRWRKSGASQTGLWMIIGPVLAWVFLSVRVTEGAQAPGIPPNSQLHSGDCLLVSILIGVPFVVILPALFVAGVWRHQRKYMEIESLRPASRSQFIGGLLSAITLQVGSVWLYFAGTTAIIGGLCSIEAHTFLACLVDIAPYLLASFLVQFFNGVLCLWIVSHARWATLLIGVAALTEFYLVFVLLFPLRSLDTGAALVSRAPAVVGIAAICMLLGLILIPFVYRRWMNLEMG